MKLAYYNFCPFSRALRIALIEKKIPFSLDILNPWESMERDIIVSPIGNIPVMHDEIGDHRFPIMSVPAGYEYLEDVYEDTSLYRGDILLHTEIRRLVSWMDSDFFMKVSSKLIEEKIIKRIKRQETPDSVLISEAFEALAYHLEYIDFLVSKRRWIAGDDFSMADIVAGAHLSIIDYLGDIHWVDYPNAKEWYMKLKSRPSFQEMLEDRIGNILPSKNYNNLDF